MENPEALSPLDDGVTHINIYSKARTKLGYLLSNLTDAQVRHPRLGVFKTLEGLWFYYSTGCVDEIFRVLPGFKAKRYGSTLPRVQQDDFEEVIKEALYCKVIQNPIIAELMLESTLPFEHYYYYGNPKNAKVINVTSNRWVVDELEAIRKQIKESPSKIDAGNGNKNNCMCVTPEEFRYCNWNCMHDDPGTIICSFSGIPESACPADCLCKDRDQDLTVELDAMATAKTENQ
ncbi:MAG: hypothetical protein CL678_15815 [Bdellovibrionaceae bacterium]|nr:hypothetical protein [Pseudobdellovibrionaceae bacterium]